jgi:hypothetical protein
MTTPAQPSATLTTADFRRRLGVEACYFVSDYRLGWTCWQRRPTFNDVPTIKEPLVGNIHRHFKPSAWSIHECELHDVHGPPTADSALVPGRNLGIMRSINSKTKPLHGQSEIPHGQR